MQGHSQSRTTSKFCDRMAPAIPIDDHARPPQPPAVKTREDRVGDAGAQTAVIGVDNRDKRRVRR
jgi:hypothetical protein